MPETTLRLTELEEQTASLLQGTAEDLFGIAQQILQTQIATVEDWELARAALSYCLAKLLAPPTPYPVKAVN